MKVVAFKGLKKRKVSEVERNRVTKDSDDDNDDLAPSSQSQPPIYGSNLEEDLVVVKQFMKGDSAKAVAPSPFA